MEVLLLSLGTALAADCDASAELGEAEASVLALELEAAADALTRVEERFACGETSPDQIAHFWLLTAGLALFQGDEDGVAEALVAARVADAEFWLDALGEDLERRWNAAEPSPALGRVTALDLPDGYTLRIDGSAVEGSSVELPSGLHVVQARGGGNGWGRVINVPVGIEASVTTSLPALEVAPAPIPEPVPIPESPGEREMPVGLYAGLGARVMLGGGYDLATVVEPAGKVGPSLELGARVPLGALVLRAGVAADIAVNGRFVYLGGDNEARSLPLAPALLVSGGYALSDRLELGVQTGIQLPGRIPTRVYGAFGLTDALALEWRLGGSLIGERTVDAGGSVERSLGFEPSTTVLATLTL